MLGRIAAIVSMLFNIAFGVFALWIIARGYWPAESGGQPIEYKDFIAILLTGLAVMIAVATILIAAGAIWGFEFLRKEAVQAAATAAKLEANSVAEKVAKDVAESVATRTARSTAPAETTELEANQLAEALGRPEPEEPEELEKK